MKLRIVTAAATLGLVMAAIPATAQSRDRESRQGRSSGQGYSSRDSGRQSRDQGRSVRDYGRSSRDQGRSYRDRGRSSRDQSRSYRNQGRSYRDYGRSSRNYGRSYSDYRFRYVVPARPYYYAYEPYYEPYYDYSYYGSPRYDYDSRRYSRSRGHYHGRSFCLRPHISVHIGF